MVNRNPKHAEAEDLFEIETDALDLLKDNNLGKTFLQRSTKDRIELVEAIVRIEEAMAASARLRSDFYHYDIAWSRVIHGTTVVKSLNKMLVTIENTRS